MSCACAWVIGVEGGAVRRGRGFASLCLFLPLLPPSCSLHWRQKVRFLKRNTEYQIHAQTSNKLNPGAIFLISLGTFKCPNAAFMEQGMFDLFGVFPSSPHFLPGWFLEDRAGKKLERWARTLCQGGVLILREVADVYYSLSWILEQPFTAQDIQELHINIITIDWIRMFQRQNWCEYQDNVETIHWRALALLDILFLIYFILGKF